MDKNSAMSKKTKYVIRSWNGEYLKFFFSLISSAHFVSNKARAKDFDSPQEAQFQRDKLPEIYSPYSIETTT